MEYDSEESPGNQYDKEDVVLNQEKYSETKQEKYFLIVMANVDEITASFTEIEGILSNFDTVSELPIELSGSSTSTSSEVEVDNKLVVFIHEERRDAILDQAHESYINHETMYEPSLNQGTVNFRSLHEKLNRFNNDCSVQYAPSAVRWIGYKLDWFDEADSMNDITLGISHDASTVRVDPDSTEQYSTAKQLFRRTPYRISSHNVRSSMSHQMMKMRKTTIQPQLLQLPHLREGGY